MVSDNMNLRLELLFKQGWALSADQNKICRHYNLDTFTRAFLLMTRVAEQAEIMGHHPDWSNSYNRLHICLTTHDLDTISLKDVELAEFIELQARSLSTENPHSNFPED